jgi:hypothetical protein
MRRGDKENYLLSRRDQEEVVMSHEVSIREHPDYIRLEVFGEWTPGQEEVDAVSTWSHVADVCLAKQKDRILAIYNVTGHLPTRTAYSVAHAPEKFGWKKHLKVALVDFYEASPQVFLFAEDVAVSSGYQVRVFDHEQDAKAWLLRR